MENKPEKKKRSSHSQTTVLILLESLFLGFISMGGWRWNAFVPENKEAVFPYFDLLLYFEIWLYCILFGLLSFVAAYFRKDITKVSGKIVWVCVYFGSVNIVYYLIAKIYCFFRFNVSSPFYRIHYNSISVDNLPVLGVFRILLLAFVIMIIYQKKKTNRAMRTEDPENPDRKLFRFLYDN